MLLKGWDSSEVVSKILVVVGILTLGLGLMIWGRGASKTDEFFEIDKHTVPVVAITTEPDNLWDKETGIYVKGNHENIFKTGDEWEREAQMKFYDKEGKLKLSQKIDLSLHGWGMRGMPQKAFRLMAKDSERENSVFDYPFFGEEGNERYGSLVLRVSDSNRTMLRDQLASRIVGLVTDIDVQLGRPVVVYLNNEYWGLYWLQERFDDEYFEERYRIEPGMLGMVEVPLRSGADRGRVVAVDKRDKWGAEKYNRLLDQVGRCRKCESYNSINKQIDADNWIDYLILELYMDNNDWPMNNVKAWWFKVEPNLESLEELLGVYDGRFRWLWFDLDVGFGLAETDPYGKLLDDAFPFKNLLAGQKFKRLYRKRVEELMKEELSGEVVTLMVEEMAGEIRPEMARQIERWEGEVGEEGYQVISSLREWEREVELLKKYVTLRPEIFLKMTKSYLEKVVY